MITTALNALKQTQQLCSSISTGAYDEGELEALLSESADSQASRICDTQTLTPELMDQILAGDLASSNPNSVRGKNFLWDDSF